MIKVLHFISDKNIGGAGKLLFNQLSAGNQSLFEYVTVIPEGSALFPLYTGLGTRCISVKTNFNSLRSIKAFREIIKNEKPHIVHTHSCFPARIAAKLCHTKTVNTKHCADEEEKFSILTKAKTRIFDTLFTDITIATAEYVIKKLEESGIKNKKITLILNGSLPIRQQTDEKKAETLKKYGLKSDDFIVGMMARLEEGKGQEILIKAAEICQYKAPKVKFLIAGSGSMLMEYIALSKNLENLQFIGFISEISDILNILNVNCCCSYVSETSSLSLSEGMSVGVIPIVSDCGGNSFMAKECGIVIPKKSPEALANALIDLSCSPTKISELKERTIKRYHTHFTAEEMTEKTENLYISLLK